jgi:MscS family membrane protein
MAPWWQTYLPSWLQAVGPYELMWWQWASIAVGVLVALGIGYLLGRLTRFVLTRVAKTTKTDWDDLLARQLGGPAVMFWSIVAYRALMPAFEPTRDAREVINRTLAALLFITLYWAVARAIRVVEEIILRSDRAAAEPNLRLLVTQMGKIARAVLFAILVVSLLAQMGYHVASLITGLGIGGIAIALAAQSSLSNLFASIGIAADRPFELGDFVEIDGQQGTVESIGLRSTRIRTLDRTVVAWPNGVLAGKKVERYTARDRIRLHAIIGVLYSTTSDQMKEILAGLEQVVRDHPHAWQDQVFIKFIKFGESALEIEVMCWFERRSRSRPGPSTCTTTATPKPPDRPTRPPQWPAGNERVARG